MTTVTRVYRFAASHRLHSPLLTEAENDRVYGKCNNPYGHGHDYVLQVSVSGVVAETGVLCNVEALDGLVEEKILRYVRDRNLNDWDEFSVSVPTTENLAVASLVTGILAVPMGLCCGVFGLAATITALITGFMARKNIKQSNGWKTGDGMALAGIVLGVIGVAMFVLYLVLFGFNLFAGSGPR